MDMNTSPILTVGETIRRRSVDHGLLAERVVACPPEELTAAYLVQGGPMGDFCDSLKDLVAHVLMWDEINLAVLTEARLGRPHWSLEPRWEQPDSGLMLNRSGVAAGREMPIELLFHRFTAVHEALTAELAGYDEQTWTAPLPAPVSGAKPDSMGALAQYVMTVPGNAPYWHAALHLGLQAQIGELEFD